MNAATLDSTRHLLRAFTRPAHARVDAQFAHGLTTVDAHATYLRGMHAFVAGIDALLAPLPLSPTWRAWSRTPRIDWLGRDLEVRSLMRVDVPHPPLRQHHALHPDASAAGTLYVLEGSALGARMLLADARRLQGDVGTEFLRHHAQPQDAQRWPRFAAALEGSAFAGAGARQALMTAAGDAFAHAERCFIAARLASTHLTDPSTA